MDDKNCWFSFFSLSCTCFHLIESGSNRTKDNSWTPSRWGGSLSESQPSIECARLVPPRPVEGWCSYTSRFIVGEEVNPT